MARSVGEVLEHAQTVMIGNNEPDFADVANMLHEGQRLVDFVGISNQRSGNGKYHGICW